VQPEGLEPPKPTVAPTPSGQPIIAPPPVSPPTSLGVLTFEGETDTELARKSMDIFERVWKGMEVKKDLNVTYTHFPIYGPEPEADMLMMTSSSHGSATIVIPSDPNELTPGAVYASTFMVLALQLAENPNNASHEELQAIYAYATDAEYEEVAKCFDEIDLIYCTFFIASYPIKELLDPIATLPAESTTSPYTEAEVPPSLGQLREFMLALINDDRAANGLTPVLLGNNPAAQTHAEEMLEQGYLSHWGMDGLKPYMRYTLAGGFNYEGENASAPASPAVEGVNYRRQSAIRSLEETQQGLMDSPGHRSNILDKWHKKVNLGIACSPITCAVSQQFEGDYIEFTETPALSKGVLRFTGGLKAPFIFDGVQIWYDQPPQPLTVGQLSFTYSYGVAQATSRSAPKSRNI